MHVYIYMHIVDTSHFFLSFVFFFLSLKPTYHYTQTYTTIDDRYIFLYIFTFSNPSLLF
ncbi:hypothetical protein BDV36DRAFT_178133 [Aspergillus pseudocaelatus]|uniref:Uncharacterized protein n=1 Tax=Aspergillus pseudocaelatus TaxID=1825620 RepID=A0ABQ6WJZ0_9EURO|nr:hypothetical protein BDV36DRAFT_178133 [Aspergillus pseudocaelatus]